MTGGSRRGTRALRGAPPVLAPLVDQFGRSVAYLRVSVTDRCNFRCVYCMPAAGLPWLPKGDVLTDDEIVATIAELAPLGLRRVRLTGGEPTIRPGFEGLVRRLAGLTRAGLEELSLSTNGVKFCQDAGYAARLKAAGLDRVNLSADSLRPERVAAIARRDLGFDAVRAAGLAEAAGLSPVKLNVVVVRGVNDDEVGDFARLTVDHPWHVRFIELMPVGELAEAYGEGVLGRVVPSEEVLARAAKALDAVGGLAPLDALGSGRVRGNGPAAYYAAPGAAGTVGVITPMTHTYCATCNRVRLTADGRLRTCLYGDHEVDLRGPLRRGEALAPHVRRALDEKPREHALLQLRTGGLRALSQVGG